MLLHFIERDALHLLSAASEGAPLDHFLPLLQEDLLGIATLNYDTLVESAGRAHGVRVSTGAEEWDGGFRWRFADDAVRLLKIHGSFTWRPSKPLDGGGGGVPNIGLYEMSAVDEPAPNNRVDSTLIFGGQVKLTPHGPFPALMRQFADWLEQADVIVAAGFGFADEHIVGAIRRWASLDANRKMIIVDPYPRTTGPFVGDTYGGFCTRCGRDTEIPSAAYLDTQLPLGRTASTFSSKASSPACPHSSERM
ncbi:SIR2 family protein [Microbacterium sp. NPDC056044]|uniref:SIR2 family protein n=1 Tax=Microbacterium sp. NPDC056044 TaxID=3345690 RepID=UPI0035E16DEA